MRLIGISGKAGTGKSTLARSLKEMGFASSWVDFGDKLKEECAEMFNFPLGWPYSEEGKERIILHQDLPMGSMRVRKILQWWGDYRRAQQPSYFVDKVRSWMEVNMPQSLIVADVRRKNEAQFILDEGGWLIRLEPHPGWKPGPYANHISETDLDDWQQWHMVISPEFGDVPQMADLISKVIPRWEQLADEMQVSNAELAEAFDKDFDKILLETVRDME